MIPDAIVQVVPERDTELASSLLQTGERIASATSCLAARAAADLAPLDVFADVTFAETMPRPGLCRVEADPTLGARSAVFTDAA